MPPRPPVAMALMAGLVLGGCSKPMAPERFAGTLPAFDPLTFWSGHTHSWGVVENRAGEPTEIVRTDCVGEAEGPDLLHMRQTLTESDGTVTHRDWHLRRTGPGRFEATANDMVGVAHGQAAGRAFHWDWVWAAGGSGNALKYVTMHQWMYLMDGGTMMNRTVVTKLGITVAQVSEQFSRVE